MTPRSGTAFHRFTIAARHDIIRLMKMDRTTLTVTTLQADTDHQDWRLKPPVERLRAVQLNRQVAYGRNRAAGRLQRVLAIVESGGGFKSVLQTVCGCFLTENQSI